MKKNWIIATRGSKLARWQADCVRKVLLEHFPDLSIRLKIVKTAGDKLRSNKLWEMGGKGVFTKEIEEALRIREADLAVHSLKDLPTDLDEVFTIGAIPFRESANDVLISKDHVHFENLPPDSVIGTSSFRRQAQILKMRPDLKVQEIRGNVSTRIKKVLEGVFDAAVVAKAGMVRLGFEEWITEEFDFDQMLPAVGQGALAVEIRSDDEEVQELLQPLQNEDLFFTTSAERAFLKAMGGGCRLPLAGYAEIQGDEIFLQGLVASVDGSQMILDQMTGLKSDFEMIGKNLAKEMLNKGAKEILQAL
ncbi:MAG: hydroxymethylbilane synthase [Chlamydiae bacterium]|nr:hydroxymethylbilane synthase [Chlamydiota bacterium]MBI3266353.1 hydroxymethylbilane synthase [Chlamydiota bacterium]